MLVLGLVAGGLVYHALQPAPGPADDDAATGGDGTQFVYERVGSIHPEGTLNHLHGIGFDRAGDRLFLATHHGLYALGAATGAADTLFRVGPERHDLMGLQIHPHEPDVLLASGHPAAGGNLGFVRSDDAGQSWRTLFAGRAGERVDFHAMSVSAADAQVVVGAYGRLYVSEDGGSGWTAGAQALGPGDCWGAPCLALDAQERATLWRGEPGNLSVSHDLGASWEVMVPTGHGGVYSHPADASLWAWSHEDGPVRYRPHDASGGFTGELLGRGLEAVPGRSVFQWTGDPLDGDVLFAATFDGATQATEIFRTKDGGHGWTRVFPGAP